MKLGYVNIVKITQIISLSEFVTSITYCSWALHEFHRGIIHE